MPVPVIGFETQERSDTHVHNKLVFLNLDTTYTRITVHMIQKVFYHLKDLDLHILQIDIGVLY